MLKVECLPYDEVDFSRVLDALATRGFLVKYASNDREFGWVPSFLTHQSINNREVESLLPKPTPENRINDFSRVPHASATRHNLDQGEKEGKGREGNREKEEEGKFEGKVSETCVSGVEEKKESEVSFLNTETQPKKKEVAGSKIFFNEAKEMFMEAYKIINNTSYYFEPKDAKAIKRIESKIEMQIRDKGKTVLSDDSKIQGFKHLLKIAISHGGSWVNTHFSLTTLDSQFNTILANYNNNRDGNTTHKSEREQRLDEVAKLGALADAVLANAGLQWDWGD